MIAVGANSDARKMILQELRTFYECSHANIVSFYGAFYHDLTVYIGTKSSFSSFPSILSFDSKNEVSSDFFCCIGVISSLTSLSLIIPSRWPSSVVALEYMDLGSLADVVKRNGPIEEAYLRQISLRLLNGLAYIHKQVSFSLLLSLSQTHAHTHAHTHSRFQLLTFQLLLV